MIDIYGKFSTALKKKDTIILTGECTVEYSGRAESYLPIGERIIIIKEDSSLLIHKPTGSAPVNYMKGQTTHRISIEDEHIVLKSNNESLKEYMRIVFHKIHFIETRKLYDGEGISLQGNERDYSDYIAEHPFLVEDGFTTVSREEKTKFGFIDIMGYDKNNILVVIECKRFKSGPSAVQQLRRYVEKIKKAKGLMRVRGILVSPDITKNALAMLNEWGFSYKKIEPPKFLEKHKKNQKKLGEY
ncbi:MAG: endonuclease NucS [Candidatus Woesearchaeota archaeon]